MLPGDGRMTLSVPVARNPDGSPITGVVRSELVVRAPATTLSLATAGSPARPTPPIPTVSTDNQTPLADGFLPTLTVRPRESAPREPIPNTRMELRRCPAGAAGNRRPEADLLPGRVPARPALRADLPRQATRWCSGLGFAATRDLGAFLKTRRQATTPAPPTRWRTAPDVRAIVMGTSQSGRMIRSFIQLGFNQGEGGGQRLRRRACRTSAAG